MSRPINTDRELWPGANETRYEDDLVARWLLRLCGTFSLEEIGALLGCVRERVRQVEEEALVKLRLAMRREGMADDVIGLLRDMAQERDSRMSVWQEMEED